MSPGANDVGLFALTLTVTDNAGAGFSLVVRGNVRAPVATTGAVTGVVRNAATVQFSECRFHFIMLLTRYYSAAELT